MGNESNREDIGVLFFSGRKIRLPAGVDSLSAERIQNDRSEGVWMLAYASMTKESEG